MIYIEYDKCKKEYNYVFNKLNTYIDKRTLLFIKTLPSAVGIKSDSVSGGVKSDPFYEYVKKKEELNIDNVIEEAKILLDEKKRILDIKELELRRSKEWYDIIYCYYFLDRISVRKIEHRVPYSRAQLFRIIKHIKKSIV